MQVSIRTSVIIGVFAIALSGVSTSVSATVRQVPSQYRTIQAAYDACKAGDVVQISSGSYTEQLYLNGPSGTSLSPITIEAAPGATVTVSGGDAKSPHGVTDVFYIEANHIVLRHLNIENGLTSGIEVRGNYDIIENCYIAHNGNFGDNNNQGQCGGFDAAVQGTIWRGNYIYANGRISLKSNHDHGLYLCDINGCEVINNLIVGNCAYGIQVAGYHTVKNMKIYNNTIVSQKNRSGIILWLPVKNIDIANNIIYGNPEWGIATWDCTGSGVRIRNNLFYGNSRGAWHMSGDDTKGSTVSYMTSKNIITKDPLFIDGTGDWNLRRGSPCIGAGDALSEVTTDYTGKARPQGKACTIGAYEYAH